jgi:hypothetical protein
MIMPPPFMKRKICCINTKIPRFVAAVFPKTGATTHHYSSRINRKGQENQSLQQLLAFFPLFLFLIRSSGFAYIISHAYHQKKKTGMLKDGWPSLLFPI